jgi:predicted DNA-binding protein (MmcQ/YjbR family)
MTSEREQAAESLRQFALSLPGSIEEFPWGERVIKVNKKIFVFLGYADNPGPELYMSVKLPHSNEQALSMPHAKPTGYNLGKAGWVQFHFPPDEIPPLEMLHDWILESYRTIAPKKLAAQLDHK